MKKLLIILLYFFTNINNAQLNLSKDEINFFERTVGLKDSINIYLKNLSSKQIIVNKIITNSKSFYLQDSSFAINPNDSINIYVYYNPVHNIINKDMISFQTNDSLQAAILKISGSGKYNDSYNASTFNLFDVQLKSVLTNLVSNHTQLGYNIARDSMFMKIDNQKVNGQGQAQNTCECVYTGRKAVGYTSRSDIQNNYQFNTEHTWPQSFFSSNEPMLSDLFHLFPTDETANSIRSNYPFGNAVSGVTWNVGGSKLGKNIYNQTVFEPRDLHKGNVARSLLYFVIRYPQNYGSFLDTVQENTFRVWNYIDTVNQIERKRNQDIASLQGKRNPFIDHPEFVDRIFSFTSNTNRPLKANLKVFPEKIFFDSTLVGDSTFQFLFLNNYGNSQLLINSIQSSNSHFSISSFVDTISSLSFQKIKLKFKPSAIAKFTGTITIQTNGGTQTLVIDGFGSNKTVSVKDEEKIINDFQLYQNYPNPFSINNDKGFKKNHTTISFQLLKINFVTLKIYDILGNEIASLIDNQTKEAGLHQVEFNYTKNSSGIFIVKLTAGNSSKFIKMNFIK